MNEVTVNNGHALTAEERQLITRALSERADSPNTTRAYSQGWSAFCAWCSNRGARALPADPVTVAAFVLDIAGALATVRLRVAAIAHEHRLADLPDPCRTETVRKALKATARIRGAIQRTAAPLRLRDADRIADRMQHRAADQKRPLHPRELRDLALLRVGHALLARANEIASITVEAIRFQDDGTALVDLMRRKTSDSTEATPLNREATQAVKDWLAAASITTGPVFVRMSRVGDMDARPLTRLSITRTLKTLAKRAGLDMGISSHSMRRGMAQDLMAADHDIGAIAQAGGWKSTAMPLRYTKDLAAADSAVARFFKKLGR
jgi:integrase